MDSANNVRRIISIKKFGMVRVKLHGEDFGIDKTVSL